MNMICRHIKTNEHRESQRAQKLNKEKEKRAQKLIKEKKLPTHTPVRYKAIVLQVVYAQSDRSKIATKTDPDSTAPRARNAHESLQMPASPRASFKTSPRAASTPCSLLPVPYSLFPASETSLTSRTSLLNRRRVLNPRAAIQSIVGRNS
jgi:hypothetical protein